MTGRHIRERAVAGRRIVHDVFKIFARGLVLGNRRSLIGILDHHLHQLVTLVVRQMFAADVVGILPGRHWFHAHRMSRDESVERDDSRDAIGMHGGKQVRELDATAETGDKDLVAAGFFADQFRGRVDVRFEKIVGPSRQLSKIVLRRLRRNEMRAIVHRPYVNALLREINLERVAWILERHLAVHVGAGQVEHDGLRMRGRRRSLGDAMQCDFVERRFADRRLESPFINSGRAFEFARGADSLEVGGRGDRRDEKEQDSKNVEGDVSSNLHGPNPAPPSVTYICELFSLPRTRPACYQSYVRNGHNPLRSLDSSGDRNSFRKHKFDGTKLPLVVHSSRNRNRWYISPFPANRPRTISAQRGPVLAPKLNRSYKSSPTSPTGRGSVHPRKFNHCGRGQDASHTQKKLQTGTKSRIFFIFIFGAGSPLPATRGEEPRIIFRRLTLRGLPCETEAASSSRQFRTGAISNE